MKCKSKEDGDIKIITKFLLIPKCIDYVWRWFEIAKIKYKYDDMKYELGLLGDYGG